MANSSIQFIQNHTHHWKKLGATLDSPATFLKYQVDYLYKNRPTISYLPQEPTVKTEQSFPSLPEMSDVQPRILNIYHDTSQRELDELHAVNIPISITEEGIEIDFPKEKFVVIRVSNILQKMTYPKALRYLKKLKRILHQNGELHLIVPDAAAILRDVVNSKLRTKNNADYLLSQIYGQGNSVHHTLYSYNLLETLLHEAGFTRVELRKKEQDLAFLCGIENNNTHELVVAAGLEKTPHSHDMVLGEKTFRKKCAQFTERYSHNPPSTFIIAVYNEEKNLPHFLSFLESSTNYTNTEREFIFVLNGCTDRSEEIVRSYAKDSLLNTRIISSEIGIVTAFIKGIKVKSLDGFIGKIDSDVILHPHLLDLMQMHLVENENVQVTYAEPMPSDSQTPYNEPDFNPSIATRRLYYTSKTSLNRVDPFARKAIRNILQNFKAEDMFLSFYFIFFYGLDSISRTPHGHTYAKTVGNFDDLVRQMSRMNSEMKREFGAYPPFGILNSVTEQEFYEGDYKETYHRAQSEAIYVSEWTRIMSTK